MLSHINLKRAAYLSALACALVFAACEYDNVTDPDNGGNFSATESFSFEVQAAGHQHFRLKGINGGIDIVGASNANGIHIWGERTVRSRSAEDARAYLNEVEVRLSEGNSELLVETIQPEDTRGREVEVIYHVRVPSHWNVRIHNANGYAQADSLNGNVVLKIANGQVQARAVTGEVEVEVTNGNVALENIVGNARVAVVNGNVAAKMILALQGKCEMNTVNGNINLAIPKNTSAQFAADVANGSITVANLTLQNATTSRNSVRGLLGGGEGKITLATINGTIQATGL